MRSLFFECHWHFKRVSPLRTVVVVALIVGYIALDFQAIPWCNPSIHLVHKPQVTLVAVTCNAYATSVTSAICFRVQQIENHDMQYHVQYQIGSF